MITSTSPAKILSGNEDFDLGTHDVSLFDMAGQVWLVGYSDLGFASWQLDTSTLSDMLLPSVMSPILAPLSLYNIGDLTSPLYLPGGQSTLAAKAFSLDLAGSAPGAILPLPLNAPATFPDRLSAIARLDGDLLVTASMGSGSLDSWRITNQSIQHLGSSVVAADIQGAAIGNLLALDGGAMPIVAAALPFEDRISIIQIAPDGTPHAGESLGASDGIGIDAPDALARMGSGNLFVAASSNTSSLLLLEAGSDGSLAAHDHVLDNGDTLLGHVCAVASFSVGGRDYLAAGGQEGGISVFTLLPDDTLHLEQTIALSWGNVIDLEAAPTSQGAELAAVTAGSPGVSRVSLAITGIGSTVEGTSSADALSGSNDDDIIAGFGGNDTLIGGGGDDLLLDGPGSDTLIGGPGADIFILTEDSMPDVILDYSPIEDRLDLSRWTFMRSLAQLGFAPTADGIEITRGNETLEIHSASGSPLSAADFDNRLLGLTRLPLPEADTTSVTLAGTPGDDWSRGGHGNDLLSGGSGNDVLMGGPGDDVLDGGAGADIIDGGTGHDMLSFASATWRVMVDLQNDAFDFGDAVGDTYANIDAITAGPYADQLRGDAFDNEFYGGRYSDRLYGRAGNDHLDGGRGVDALYGNAGADVLTGGGPSDQRDRFIYFHAADSRPGEGNHDRITDFVSGVDRVEISRLDADLATAGNQAFTLIGTTPFSGSAGELRYLQDSVGNTTLLQADMDGDGLADFEIAFDGIHDFTADDFLL